MSVRELQGRPVLGVDEDDLTPLVGEVVALIESEALDPRDALTVAQVVAAVMGERASAAGHPDVDESVDDGGGDDDDDIDDDSGATWG